MKNALVISGGGARGAFAAGVVKYVYQAYGRDGWFDIVGGTSTGALITPLAALLKEPSLAPSALQTLEKMYTTVTNGDILRRRCILTLPFRDGVNSTAPLRKIIEQNLTEERFAYLQTPQAPTAYVVYTNFKTGQVKRICARKEDMQDGTGEVVTIEAFREAILASASMPVYMEPVRMKDGACYDGGVRDILPLGNAIDLGAETILPIFLDPDKFGESENKFKRMDKILFRTLEIMMNESLDNDVDKAELINAAVVTKTSLRQQFAGQPEALARINAILASRPDLYGDDKRLIKIRTDIRPDKPLGEDVLDFIPAVMRQWLKDGYEKARALITTSPFNRI